MDRYGQTAERYLAEHHVLVYLEDSISQLLEHREENPKVNTHKFLAEYFSSLRDGNHTMFRNFSFIKATPHNRAAFIRLFWNSFKQIGQRGDLLSMKEYHSLTRLLCPDFPLELLQKTARIVLMDDALDCLISFPDFLYAFQVQFYYEEFLEKATELYRSLQQSQKSPREAVVVPSSTDDQPSVCQRAATQRQEAVEGSLLFRHLYQLCDKAEFSVPPNSVLKELLDISQVTYCGFLLFIAKSDTINKTIGQLPPKVELLEIISREINVPSLQLAVSNKPAVITSGVDNSAKPSRTSTNTAPKTVRITKQKLKVSGSREIRRKSEKSSSSSSSGHSDGSTTD